MSEKLILSIIHEDNYDENEFDIRAEIQMRPSLALVAISLAEGDLSILREKLKDSFDIKVIGGNDEEKRTN